MASSIVDIANIALTLLGAEPINAITDDTVAARTISLHYGPARDAELMSHNWRFSVKRVSMAALADAPIGPDYTLRYQLPDDFLSVVRVGDFWPGQDRSDYRQTATAEYSIEGQEILTNYSSPLRMIYNALIEDSTLFDPAFVLALASRVAEQSCEKITGSDSKRKTAQQAYDKAISNAIQSNALLNAPEFAGDNSWVMSRLG